MTEKHAAEVLADECEISAEYWLREVGTRRRAAAMLRTIPALEAECDALRENYEYVLGHCREAQTLAMELRTDFRRLNEKHTNLHLNAAACRKERDALRADLETEVRLNNEGQAREDALRAEVEALRADAERAARC